MRDRENLFAEKITELVVQCFEVIKKSETRRNALMLKLYQVEKKLEELREILDINGQEIKKLEQQLQIIKDEIKDYEQVNSSSKDAETLTPQRAIYMLQITFRFYYIKFCKLCLKFLQLLCENHNRDLQDTLREQLNFEGNPNGKTFDIVTLMAKLFGQYSKIFNQVTVELGYQIVDCLIEAIQGPCHKNQKALISAKIIDSSRDYIAGFDKEVEYIPLGFNNTIFLVLFSVFKKKIVTLLLSLLEGETDMDIITRMSLSLDFGVMKERMLVVFSNFCQKMLGNDFTTIAEVSIQQLNSKLEKDSFEGNISEAFEIFIWRLQLQKFFFHIKFTQMCPNQLQFFFVSIILWYFFLKINTKLNYFTQIFTLFHNLAENLESAKNNLDRKKFTLDEWKAYEFIRSHTGRIEIAVQQNLQRVYFPIVPVCHYISKESRKNLMTDVNRESQASKVNGLLSKSFWFLMLFFIFIFKCPDLIDEMMHNEALNRSKIKITPQRLFALKDFSTFMAVLINLVLIIFLERVNKYKESFAPDYEELMIYYMGIVQGTSSGILIFFYAYTRGGLITKAKWREYIHKNKTFYKPFVNDDRLDVKEMRPEAVEFNIGDSLKFGNAFTRLQYYIFNIMFFFQDGTFQYYVLYFMISLLGFFYLDIFYAFHLLKFVKIMCKRYISNFILHLIHKKNSILLSLLYHFNYTRLPVLQNVIKSVTLNKTQLLMTGLLQIVIIFIYSTIGFFYLQDTFVDFNVDKYDSDNCFVTCVNLGLRNGGGIGDSTLPIGLIDAERWLVKFIYDCTFHLTVIVMMLNILFGIIIDTFAQLRDNKKQMDEDMQNICFICSLDRYTFDKYSDGFERHIERDHNLWQYVFYIVYLQMKDQTEYTGIESYVFEKYESNDISWVPLMKALCLKGKIE